MGLPPKRPDRATLPAGPKHSGPNEAEPVSDRHRDSLAPQKWELDKALTTVREALEKQEALLETVDELSANLARERRRAEELEDRLARWQRESRSDDDVRDRALEQARKDLRDLADRVDMINRPRTEAAASSTTATMLNLARKKELLKQVAYFVALVLLALAQLFGWRAPGRAEPTETIPIPQVREAQPGFQH